MEKVFNPNSPHASTHCGPKELIESVYVRADSIMPEQLHPGSFIVNPSLILPDTQVTSFHSTHRADVHFLNSFHPHRRAIYTFTVGILLEYSLDIN